jgi:hypothetical protein
VTIITSVLGQSPTDLHATDEVVATTLPVDLPTNTYRTLMRVVVPVRPGDLLDVHGWGRVSNRVGYNVGVGYHLWQYDVDNGLGSSGEWTRISPLKGDNVDMQRHHLPFDVSCVYRVPAGWPAGGPGPLGFHRMTVVLRADAHSTAWEAGDALTVDRAYGHLVVRRWAAPVASA